MSDEEKALERRASRIISETPHDSMCPVRSSTGFCNCDHKFRAVMAALASTHIPDVDAHLSALQGASSGEGDAPKGLGGCEHEWVNEACDGNHYNCQRCPATFIYDRNADEPTLSPSDRDMRDAAQALIDKLEIIHADSRYASVWAIAQDRLGPYTGPQYEHELQALIEALSQTGKEG